MSTSETPMCDARTVEFAGFRGELVNADFARQLERELNGWKEGHATLERTCQLLGQDVASLRSELAAAKADSERLDWLLTQLSYKSRVEIGIGFRDPRAAIDAARAGGGK